MVYRLDHRVAVHYFADPGRIGVIEQATLAVDHVQVGAVLVVVLAEQVVEDIVLLQVDAGAEIAEVVALAIADRMGNVHHQVAGGRDVGGADQRPLLAQRLQSSGALQLAAYQLQGLRRGGQHGACGADHQHRVEVGGLQAQAVNFLGQYGAVVHPLGQLAGAEG
ncbi:hypothetical protein D3C75_800970 [compost metagenome]